MEAKIHVDRLSGLAGKAEVWKFVRKSFFQYIPPIRNILIHSRYTLVSIRTIFEQPQSAEAV
jgi:hypothetical protein